MPDIELVVTNNLARARARMSSSSQYNDLNEQSQRNEPSVEIMRDSATEDDYLLSPRRTRRG